MARKNDINFDYNTEVKKCKTIDDVLGKNGLVQRLVKDVLENILEAEMDEHLGYDRYERSGEPNYRNGTKPKTVRSKYGQFEVDVPQAGVKEKVASAGKTEKSRKWWNIIPFIAAGSGAGIFGFFAAKKRKDKKNK